MTTQADADQWRHFHRQCHLDGVFRSSDEAAFVVSVHGGHGPNCKQYLSARAYSQGSGDEADYAG